MSRSLLSFFRVRFLASRFGSSGCYLEVSELLDVFAVVQFSESVPSAFGVRCARLCGCPVSAFVSCSGSGWLVWVPISSAGLHWFQVGASSRWLVRPS